MNQAFCILAAGRGSRLGELTSTINKALLPVDNKAAISHIIEKVPVNCEIVVAVGYDREKVKEYCLAAHPERLFTFVEVDKLEGPGSGPGYSLLCCQEYLQQPFYLCNVDTLVDGPLIPLDCNWIGVAQTDRPERYCTVSGCGSSVEFYDKDPNGTEWAYIGLAGITDWAQFWSSLANNHQNVNDYQYIVALDCLDPLRLYSYDWFDTGSVEGYAETCRHFQGTEILGLPKNINEITYKVNGRLIKLCLDIEKNKQRLKKANLLSGLTPTIVCSGSYVMAYEWVEGDTLYHNRYDQSDWFSFFDWCHQRLWVRQEKPADWNSICYEFYYWKTLCRLDDYYTSRNLVGGVGRWINGRFCSSLEDNVPRIDWKSLSNGICVQNHGDLQFDNVLYGYDGCFYLIDWRESFGSLNSCGDLYYDLAKLYSGLEMPYDLLKRGEFILEKDDEKVRYSFQVDIRRLQFRDCFEHEIDRLGYNLEKIRTLAALVYLNMAALHPGALGDLLYYHGIFNLSRLLNE